MNRGPIACLSCSIFYLFLPSARLVMLFFVRPLREVPFLIKTAYPDPVTKRLTLSTLGHLESPADSISKMSAKDLMSDKAVCEMLST